MTVVVFIVVLAVLIFVHELGHFLAAKAFGIRVDAFKIGFGPKIFAWKRGETEYGVNWVPFGGYVRIHGENPDQESLDPASADASRSFVLKPRWQQAIVLFAGVFFNFVFAWLLYAAVFTTGVTASTIGFERYSTHFSDPRVMITYVSPGSPADKAGLQEGDVVRSVDSQPSLSLIGIQDLIAGSGSKPVTIGYTRGSSSESATVTPTTGIVPDRYAIGISMDNVVDLRLPFLTAVWEGLHYTWVLITETVVGLYSFLANIFVGHPDFSQVAGPVGIAGIVGNAAELGLKYLIMVTAIISINLGVINLIPFPALDGGRILFVAIEGAVRKRIPAGFSNTVNLVGFALLMILMVAVTWKDIANMLK